MAAINAHQKINEKEAVVLKRSEAYIGVLIDDLVNKGTDEPYRMFTSRAEHRILLRQDNADIRLTKIGYDLGLADASRLEKVEKKVKETSEVATFLRKKSVDPNEINTVLLALESAPSSEKAKAANLLKRPNMEIEHLAKGDAELANFLTNYSQEGIEQASIEIKYESYIEKENQHADRMKELENYVIRERLDYNKMPALSHEARQKLLKINPETIGQASRISGVSPADISVLMVYLGK
jgi:tRNA uridine 5-carboxymethylaminomethyl modification enzyme